MRNSLIPLISLSLVVLTTFSVNAQSHITKADADIEALVSTMTIDEKVGQLLMFGIGGTKVGQVAEAHITKRLVGGLVLFGKNVKDPVQLANLIAGLQQLSLQTQKGIPLLIAMDQEGGTVVRMKKGATVLPGNLALGATRSIVLAEKAGRLTAVELSAVGVNMNFAPVIDVNTNPKNPVIGVRSFGESADLVAQMGTAYIRGLQRNGVLATAKHFPGHGDTTVDSHKKLPIITHDNKRIETVELRPFRAAIKADVAAIMSAHILYPELDPELPSTLSYNILTKLLRQKLGFNGVIITDDIEMQAIDANYESGKAAVMAIQAGADIVLVPWNLKKQQRVYNTLRQAVRNGRITETRLNQSVRRILKSKKNCNAFEKREEYRYASNPIDGPIEIVGNSKHRETAQIIASQAITLLKNDDNILPLSTDSKDPLLLLSPSRLFSNTFLKAHPELEHITPVIIPPKVNPEYILPILLKNNAKLIVAGIQNAQQADLIHQFSQKTDTPIIVILLSSPYLFGKCPDVSAAIAAYDDNYYSLLGAIEILLGKKQAVGKLPVTIP